MRRRMGFVSAVAALLTIVVAGNPVAAGTTYYSSISNATCYLQGGAYDNGSVVADTYMQELGHSGTNYFSLTAYLQEYQGGWVDIDSKTVYSPTFGNNNTSHYFTHHFKLNVVDNSQYYHRIQVWYYWWHFDGPDYTIWSSHYNGRKC